MKKKNNLDNTPALMEKYKMMEESEWFSVKDEAYIETLLDSTVECPNYQKTVYNQKQKKQQHFDLKKNVYFFFLTNFLCFSLNSK